jgi:hypothetical protein
MPKRRKGNTLEKWEISLIKTMLAQKGSNDQDILAYFTRPTRSVNHRAIGEIRTEKKHKTVKPATPEELDAFLATWPDLEPQTGLSTRGDELLIKAREAMIAAVHMFNGAGLTFRAELFIVTAIIAWTYLLHAWFKREGIDYRHRISGGAIKKTKSGEDYYWELGKCLQHSKCPLSKGVIANLEFLIELRNEIEHRSTSRIDDAVSAKLQACCINFNDAIIKQFGPQFSLERRLPIALQCIPPRERRLNEAATSRFSSAAWGCWTPHLRQRQLKRRSHSRRSYACGRDENVSLDSPGLGSRVGFLAFHSVILAFSRSILASRL